MAIGLNAIEVKKIVAGSSRLIPGFIIEVETNTCVTKDTFVHFVQALGSLRMVPLRIAAFSNADEVIKKINDQFPAQKPNAKAIKVTLPSDPTEWESRNIAQKPSDSIMRAGKRISMSPEEAERALLKLFRESWQNAGYEVVGSIA